MKKLKKPNWHNRKEKWGTANPYEILQKKTEIALEWTYNWGWTTPFILDLLTQSGKRGFTKKLEQTGLLHSVEMYSFTPGMPRKILRITKKGCLIINKEYRQKKINYNVVWHDYVVQVYTAISLLKNGFPQKKISYIPFPQEKEKYEKNYDAVIAEKIGIEVELTKKKPIRANINIFKMLTDIINKKIEYVIFVSLGGTETFKPYRDILTNRKVTEYGLDKYRKPYKIREYTINEQLTKRFKFYVLPKPLSVQQILESIKS